MKSLTPINSLSGIDSNGHHDHKVGGLNIVPAIAHELKDFLL